MGGRAPVPTTPLLTCSGWWQLGTSREKPGCKQGTSECSQGTAGHKERSFGTPAGILGCKQGHKEESRGAKRGLGRAPAVSGCKEGTSGCQRGSSGC